MEFNVAIFIHYNSSHDLETHTDRLRYACMYKFAFFKRLCLLSFCRVQKSFYLFKFTLLLINFFAINCFPPKKPFLCIQTLIVLNIITWEYSHSVMPCICIYNVNCWQFCLTNECLYAKEKFWFLELWIHVIKEMKTIEKKYISFFFQIVKL